MTDSIDVMTLAHSEAASRVNAAREAYVTARLDYQAALDRNAALVAEIITLKRELAQVRESSAEIAANMQAQVDEAEMLLKQERAKHEPKVTYKGVFYINGRRIGPDEDIEIRVEDVKPLGREFAPGEGAAI